MQPNHSFSLTPTSLSPSICTEKTLENYANIVEGRTQTLINEIANTPLDENFSKQFPLSDPELIKGMHYGAEGGKKLRAYMLSLSAELIGMDPDIALDFGCALEMIHSYSLIHDDLPAFDNANRRRGKPSVHLAYGEADAILIGTALLTHGYEIIANLYLEPAQKLVFLTELSKALGVRGLMEGQCLDLKAEREPEKFKLEHQIHLIQFLKTGAMFKYALVSPLMAYAAPEEIRQAIDEYAYYFGIIYQMADDILDHEGSSVLLGKPVGRDNVVAKATFVDLYGLEKAKEYIRLYVDKAHHCLKKLDARTKENLMTLAEFAAFREK